VIKGESGFRHPQGACGIGVMVCSEVALDRDGEGGEISIADDPAEPPLGAS
jgi:hypothetical protein